MSMRNWFIMWSQTHTHTHELIDDWAIREPLDLRIRNSVRIEDD